MEGRPLQWQLWHQEPASPTATQVSDLHWLLLIVAIAICVLVMGLLGYVIYRFRAERNPTPSRTSHNTLLEVVWTTVPVLILLVIAVPSFRLLYFLDRTEDPEVTVIARGYQWYWGYEYPDQAIPEFSSFMVEDADLQPGQTRLLSTTEPLILPVDTDIQVLVTASDVLHSWSVPAFAVKRDAIPGRMNQLWIRIEQEGTYYGQCFELCGIRHAYMPIEVRAVSREAFDDWVLQRTAGLNLPEPPVLLTRGETRPAGQPALAAAGPESAAPRPN